MCICNYFWYLLTLTGPSCGHTFFHAWKSTKLSGGCNKLSLHRRLLLFTENEKRRKKRRSFPSPFSPQSPTRSLKQNSRDLTKPRRRGQREQRQKAIGLMSKATNVHVHHAFLHISLPFLHNHGVKWPISFEFTWVRERQDDRFYHLCLNSCAVSSLHLQNKFPSFK